MDPRALELIDQLALTPHPEGGYFREIFRSSTIVQSKDKAQERCALTEIFFLLPAGQVSCWHQVSLDEVWHYYEGAPLDLFWFNSGEKAYQHCLLAAVGETSRPVSVVPAGCWQGARTTGAYTLVGCTVAPGFEFADFRLLQENPEQAKAVRKHFPELADLI